MADVCTRIGWALGTVRTKGFKYAGCSRGCHEGFHASFRVSTFSHVNTSGRSERPKWPYAAVWM